MHLIVYTTKYRTGGDKFPRIAATRAKELEADGKEVLCKSIESKKDLKAIFHSIKQDGKTIESFHFIGHSGMYGPMYGTMEFPEQFSPYEWKQLEIPFAENAEAYFLCCRSARWFANFFANTFKVTTYGYHWYTSFSSSPTKFKADKGGDSPLYAIGCVGKKSHGYIGSIKKYLGAPAEELKQFKPGDNTDTSYDKVAELYDAVFQDIKVREDEWAWLDKHVPNNPNQTIIDIGCGNGALLNELSDRMQTGIGLDRSASILRQAEKMNASNPHISFKQITSPILPLEDASVDVAISMLSFRYLDWDPLMNELKRVLKPGGKFLVVDMVAVPAKLKHYPTLLESKFKHYQHRKKYPEYYTALQKLVKHPDWQLMLKYNPIRAEHEMLWYLESRFEGRKVEKINIGYHSSVLAFDSGDFHKINALELSYP